MRRTIVAGNWKMNGTLDEAKALMETLIPLVNHCEEADVVFCPPFIDLALAAQMLQGTDIALGAQNMYFEEKGAYTGEISPAMLVGAGCQYVILGHSERRTYFGETDADVNQKVVKALQHGLKPILCCGENQAQRQNGETLSVVEHELREAFRGVSADDARKVIVAYEPLWAIGTGVSATKEQAQEVCRTLRGVLGELYGGAVAEDMRILYGGSVNAQNAAELFGMPDIDGGLVGGASLKAEFAQICHY